MDEITAEHKYISLVDQKVYSVFSITFYKKPR